MKLRVDRSQRGIILPMSQTMMTMLMRFCCVKHLYLTDSDFGKSPPLSWPRLQPPAESVSNLQHTEDGQKGAEQLHSHFIKQLVAKQDFCRMS